MYLASPLNLIDFFPKRRCLSLLTDACSESSAMVSGELTDRLVFTVNMA